MINSYHTLIIDASHLAYRVYFALPAESIDYPLVQGFISSLVSLTNKFSVRHLIVVWDRGHIQKSQIYPGYKQKQDVMTPSQREDFISQINLLEELLYLLGVRCCFEKGVEADDVIAHLCIEGCVKLQDSENEFIVSKPILILSSDHDLHPLLGEDVDMWKPHKDTVYGTKDFQQEFRGLQPEQYHYLQALMGCSGDKVPGVRGVGLKHALTLIQRFGSLQGIKDSVEEDRLVDLVKKNWEMVELCYKLVVFEEVVPVMKVLGANLSRARKLIFSKGMDMLLEDWLRVSTLGVGVKE